MKNNAGDRSRMTSTERCTSIVNASDRFNPQSDCVVSHEPAMTTESMVSVVIPTHKRVELLKRAIQSVLDQTYRNVEIFVIENGELGQAKGVVDAFQQQAATRLLRYLYQPQPDPSAARNLGIQAARGKYLAFLDDDDQWLPQKLERQVDILDRNPEVGLVTCGAWLVREADVMEEDHIYPDDMFTVSGLVKRGCLIRSLSGVVIRRECVDRIGVFDSRYFCANDYDFYLRVARTYRIASLQESLFRYHVHVSNMSANLERVQDESIQVLKRLAPALQLHVTHSMIRQRIARWHHTMAVNAMDAKQYAKATSYYLQALLHDPFIGSRLAWGRYNHPIYRTIRPYLASVFCCFGALRQRIASRCAIHG